jgi:tRNA/rRNA methyltransferase
MNLGQAVAICLYELARDVGKVKRAELLPASGHTKVKLASAGELERLTSLLLEALRASGYLEEKPVAAREEKIRRMFRRLNLSAADAEIRLGMLRQVVWKLNQR